MPIRTHRGRAAVYRRFWGWPLRSPRHLAVALIVVAGIGFAVSAVLPKAPVHTYRTATPTTTSRAVTTEPTPVPTTGVDEAGIPGTGTSVPQAAPVPAAPSPDALSVIDQWGKAWVHHPAGITGAQWLAGLKPYTTDEYLAVMSSIDPANVPASAVTGKPTSLSATTSSVQATLPTDAGPVRVLAISTGSGWRVAGYSKGS